jgi:hypothetical protein
MVAGQVSYHDRTKVKRLKVVKENAIVNALNRTKTVSGRRELDNSHKILPATS